MYSAKLNVTLRRILDSLILDVEEDAEETHNEKIPKPHLSPVVNLVNAETLHGLYERIVAVESLVFLSKQFEYLQGYLEHLVPTQNKMVLQQFYNQVSEKQRSRNLFLVLF